MSCVLVIYCLLCIFGFLDTSSSIDKSVPLEMPNQRSAIAQAQGNISCIYTCINARVQTTNMIGLEDDDLNCRNTNLSQDTIITVVIEAIAN